MGSVPQKNKKKAYKTTLSYHYKSLTMLLLNS